MSSNDYRQGLGRAFAFQRLWGDGERFCLSDEQGSCVVRFRHPGSSPLARAVLAECALAEVLLGARRLVALDVDAHAVAFAHSPLGNGSELAAWFGATPRHGAPDSSLTLAPEVSDRPLHVLRDALSAAFTEQCQRALAALPAGSALMQRVRGVVRDEMEGQLTLRSAAAKLRMSARTLQRGLSREGTSFRQIVDGERRAFADELIARGAATKEAALAVGFADQSALARARRRWLGGRKPEG
jgi:AraC-like DNA-binding protein